MSKVNLPGFTAESALYNGQDPYQNCTPMAPGSQVIPQVINRACWDFKFNRTFTNCMLFAGGDMPDCIEVAADLADLVCDF
jgi:hypothetical protein